MPEPLRWTIAALAAAVVSLMAWRLRALDASGALAATAVGAIVFGFGGLPAAAVLLLFFVSSSALSRIRGDDPRSVRGARQVLANGSVPAAAAALFGTFPGAPIALVAALAGATADTWATEIGLRFGGRPHSILTREPRRPGASGAVSAAGTAGSALGALVVALAGGPLLALPGCAWAAAALSGFAAALLDSVLGDSLQAAYVCPRCGARPEVRRHPGCSARARRVSGLTGLDNDMVNFVTSLAAAALALGLQSLC